MIVKLEDRGIDNLTKQRLLFARFIWYESDGLLYTGPIYREGDRLVDCWCVVDMEPEWGVPYMNNPYSAIAKTFHTRTFERKEALYRLPDVNLLINREFVKARWKEILQGKGLKPYKA